MLILGGSATVTDLTGMNTIAVSVRGQSWGVADQYAPPGMFPHPPRRRNLRRSRRHARDAPLRLVSPRTSHAVQGPHRARSTHTTVLFAIIFVFVFTVYGTSPKIGSIAAMHDLLAAAAEKAPVAGNAGGSYLTIRSKNGLIFGVINVIGNFATVFQDQAVRAIVYDDNSGRPHASLL